MRKSGIGGGTRMRGVKDWIKQIFDELLWVKWVIISLKIRKEVPMFESFHLKILFSVQIFGIFSKIIFSKDTFKNLPN